MSNSKDLRQLGGWGKTESLLALCFAWGCNGQVVEVGDAEDTTEDESPVSEGGSNSTQGDVVEVDCSARDASMRANYDAWKAAPNELSSLFGKHFEGYLEGGDEVVLTVGADGKVEVMFGAFVSRPAVKDQGYLCGSEEDSGRLCDFPLPGTPYEVHGASLENGRLIVPFKVDSPYEPWCVLQTPRLAEFDANDVPVPCVYDVMTSQGLKSQDDGMCLIGGEWEARCDWAITAIADGGPCTCTSTECFARIGFSSDELIDARLNETGDGFTGSLVTGNQTQPIYLFEVTD